MNSATFRQQLDQALTQASGNGTAQSFCSSPEQLHSFIRLPDDASQQSFQTFACDYIRQVPEMLQACASVALEAGIERQLRPLFQATERPLRAALEAAELMDLLQQAYLAHRLIEEINDRYIMHFGRAFTPLDTTVDNLLAYELIGADDANRLDTKVAWILDDLLDETLFTEASAQAFRQQLGTPQIMGSWNRPCLSRQHGIGLHLSPDAAPDGHESDFTLINGRWNNRGKALQKG